MLRLYSEAEYSWYPPATQADGGSDRQDHEGSVFFGKL